MVLQADAVLLEFLQSREALAKSILNTDRSLAEKERELKSTLWAGEMPLPVEGQAGGRGTAVPLGGFCAQLLPLQHLCCSATR